MSDPVLQAKGLAKTYDDGTRTLRILRSVDLAVRAGEVVAVVGKSGTGKSTLLHLLGLLDRPTSGEIQLQGRPVASMSDRERTRLRGRTIGFVFQHYHLLGECTALENVALAGAVGAGGGLGGANRKRARELLDAVGLADREGHMPGQLSGGEQQRVAIARALMAAPALLLGDEPTGNLDPETGGQVLEIFWQVVRSASTAMVMVTHDTEVGRRADRVLRLADGTLTQETA